MNTGDNAGFCAIHLINALNTGGFQIQSGDKAKGQFAFTFTGHYSMDAQDTVPYEIYIKQGGEATLGSVLINTHALSMEVGDDVTLTATTIPAGQTVTWSSSASGVATVGASTGVVHGAGAGNAIITATITVEGVSYTDTCTVIVESA